MSSNRYKACIFDLDGTILYTLESIALAGNRMLKELGFSALPLDGYRYYCGDGARNLVIRCLREAGGLSAESIEAGDRLNRQFLAEQPLYHVRPYEGMQETLSALKREGFLLGVCTNKPDEAAQDVVAGAFGTELFSCICGQKKGRPIKPDPAGALAVAKTFGVQPAECLYFGDTGTDMQTGRNAGMHTVGVLWGYRDQEELLENGADELISSPEEILSIIENQKKNFIL